LHQTKLLAQQVVDEARREQNISGNTGESLSPLQIADGDEEQNNERPEDRQTLETD